MVRNVKALTMYVTDLGSIPGTTNGFAEQAWPGVIPEQRVRNKSWAQPGVVKQTKNNTKK